MAITQVNPTDFNYADLSDAQTQTYKGKADITISEYDTDSAPDVKVGSVFENNGTLFIVDTADITPTGYSGISNSTTFYLYYDESAGAFIFASTVPVWSDALQGWYNGNDRAFFSMYKDSTGLLYQAKNRLEGASRLLTKIIPIGDWNMDLTSSVQISHGLDYTTIRTLSATIRKDVSGSITGEVYPLDYEVNPTLGDGGRIKVLTSDPTKIELDRQASAVFDNTSFDDTSFNRGWIIIQYMG